jgi:hypothetical protein
MPTKVILPFTRAVKGPMFKKCVNVFCVFSQSTKALKTPEFILGFHFEVVNKNIEQMNQIFLQSFIQ